MKKAERPDVLTGITVKVKTSCGNMYVQLNRYDGKLFEVFATLGKSGGCTSCQIEAITRCITLGLRYGIPLEEYVDQLQGIHCPNPNLFPKKSAILSCPDAIAKTLAQYGSSSLDDVPQGTEILDEKEEGKRAMGIIETQIEAFRELE